MGGLSLEFLARFRTVVHDRESSPRQVIDFLANCPWFCARVKGIAASVIGDHPDLIDDLVQTLWFRLHTRLEEGCSYNRRPDFGIDWNRSNGEIIRYLKNRLQYDARSAAKSLRPRPDVIYLGDRGDDMPDRSRNDDFKDIHVIYLYRANSRNLTDKERAVFSGLLFGGKTRTEIAKESGMSNAQVYRIAKSMHKKIALEDREHYAFFLNEEGRTPSEIAAEINCSLREVDDLIADAEAILRNLNLL